MTEPVSEWLSENNYNCNTALSLVSAFGTVQEAWIGTWRADFLRIGLWEAAVKGIWSDRDSIVNLDSYLREYYSLDPQDVNDDLGNGDYMDSLALTIKEVLEPYGSDAHIAYVITSKELADFIREQIPCPYQ